MEDNEMSAIGLIQQVCSTLPAALDAEKALMSAWKLVNLLKIAN